MGDLPDGEGKGIRSGQREPAYAMTQKLKFYAFRGNVEWISSLEGQNVG